MNIKTKAVVAGVSLILASFLLPHGASSKELKVGVINIEKIYASYEKAKQTTSEFQAERKQKQDEMDKKNDELKKMMDNYVKEKDSLTEAQRKEAETKIVAKRTEVMQFGRQTDDYLIKKNQQVTQARLQEISDTITKYAKENGFDLIIDKKSLPFFSQAFDISNTIITRVNAKK